MVTIIKPRSPGVYEVIQIRDGQRQQITMLAKSARQISANMLEAAKKTSAPVAA